MLFYYFKDGLLAMDVSNDGNMIATAGDRFINIWKVTCDV